MLLASPPLNFQESDSYFVVAHFHYVVFGTVVFATFAGFYFWWPKWTGKMLDERLGRIHFWTLFVGFHGTFLVQHWLGVQGFPRRYFTYGPNGGFSTLNLISSVSSFLLGASTLPFFINVWVSMKGPKVAVDDPWGYWATSCPPPRHNFHRLPRIRSERPAFDLKFPHLASTTNHIDPHDMVSTRRHGEARVARSAPGMVSQCRCTSMASSVMSSRVSPVGRYMSAVRFF